MSLADTQDRYDAIDLSRDETVIFDRDNPSAWIQGYGHPVEDLR